MNLQDFENMDLPESILWHARNMPPCVKALNSEIINMVDDSQITIRCPVQPEFCNPYGSMQGGFITAAFDNAFGALSLLSLKRYSTTLSLNTVFHRPIFPGDTLTIEAKILSRGRNVIYMRALAYNEEKKHIASADTNYVLVPDE
ncbi:MAG: PaaI family thioesterase [Syntrophomonadaceae bacterium]|jgi:uncharacterized protein (TIGR00369 family)|nr:PaaI family thioesterase [Syntrophomonadaceae bacterium]